MDYRDNRQRWAESHQVVHFYAGQWCTFTPALTRRPHHRGKVAGTRVANAGMGDRRGREHPWRAPLYPVCAHSSPSGCGCKPDRQGIYQGSLLYMPSNLSIFSILRTLFFAAGAAAWAESCGVSDPAFARTANPTTRLSGRRGNYHARPPGISTNFGRPPAARIAPTNSRMRATGLRGSLSPW